MDFINTKIGQSTARESASVITDKSFTASHLVGLSTGVSQHVKSELSSTNSQVKNTDRMQSNLAEQERLENSKKAKENHKKADTFFSEQSVNFSSSLNHVSQLMQINGTNISFELTESTQNPVVIVTDRENGEVIRQIPSEEVLKFAEHVNELVAGSSIPNGIVIDKQA